MNASPPVSRHAPLFDIAAVAAVFAAVRLAGKALGFSSAAGPVAVVCAVLLATWLLDRRGLGWRALGFVRPPHLGKAAGWVVATYVGILVLAGAVNLVASALHWPPQDLSRFASLEGDTLRYLALLIPVVWGTAAFGEELLFRGFLANRLERWFGGTRAAVALAVIGQALVFGAAHAYLGPRGMANAAAVGLVMGGVYLMNGRNLWALIVAHGIVDSLGITLIYLGLMPA